MRICNRVQLLLVYLTLAATAFSLPEDHPLRPLLVDTVPEFSGNDFVPIDIAKARRPVVLRGGVSHWPATQRWGDEAYLREGLRDSVLTFTRNSTVPGFNLAGERPLRVEMRNHYSTADVAADVFLDAREDPAHKLYYSGPLENWPALVKDAPVNELALSPRSRGAVWMGHAGVTANLHFDRSENFFAQIVGTKHWALFDATETPNLYPYPSFHPHYRQSQVDFTATAESRAARTPNFSNARGMEVTLEAGDVLFVPPFWFHQVTCVDYGISISMLSPSHEEQTLNDALGADIPVDAGWPAPAKAMAARAAAVALVKGALGVDGAAAAAARGVLAARYGTIGPALEGKSRIAAPFAKHQCFKDARSGKSLRQKGLDSRVAARMESWGRQVGEFLSELPAGIIDTAVGNMLEELAAAGVGAENIPVFLKHCLAEEEGKEGGEKKTKKKKRRGGGRK